MQQGVVTWFGEVKGFGFIAPDDGSGDVFVHYSQIRGSGFTTLVAEQGVEFEIGQGLQGQQAERARAL